MNESIDFFRFVMIMKIAKHYRAAPATLDTIFVLLSFIQNPSQRTVFSFSPGTSKDCLAGLTIFSLERRHDPFVPLYYDNKFQKASWRLRQKVNKQEQAHEHDTKEMEGKETPRRMCTHENGSIIHNNNRPSSSCEPRFQSLTKLWKFKNIHRILLWASTAGSGDVVKQTNVFTSVLA